MLRLVPVGRELVRRPDVERPSVDRQWFRRLEPRPKCLVGELLTRALQETRPGFLHAEAHDGECGKLREGERRSTALDQIAIGCTHRRRLALAASYRRLDLCLSARYVYRS